MTNDLTLTSATYDTTGKKFGTAALSGGYGIVQSTTGALFGTSNTWTMECWAKRTGAPGALEIIMGSTDVAYIGVDTSGHAQGSAVGMGTTVNVVDGAWHHFELSSSSGGLVLFVDGISVATNATPVTAPSNVTMGVRTFGGSGTNAGYTFGGEVDEAATWSIQRHTAGFTAPTTAYTGSENGLASLWHLDSSGTDSTGSGGSGGGTNNLTLTSVSYDTSGKKFGTAALSGGYGIIASTSSGLFGSSGSWTMECWAKRSSAPSSLEVVMGGVEVAYIAVTSAGLVQMSVSTIGGIPDGPNICDGTWHHLELSEGPGGYRCYVDGVLYASGSSTFVAPPTVNLGVRVFGNASLTFGGEVDEAATWNIQRHTSGFTSPTTAYTGSESGLTALWHLDSSGTDSTGSGGGGGGGGGGGTNSLTLTSATYDTSGKKFGTAALNGGYGIVASTSSGLFGSSGSWTMECWAKRSGAPSSLEVVMGNAFLGYIAVTSAGLVQMSVSTIGGIPDGPNICDGTWHHLELSEGPGGYRCYVDGVLYASGSNTFVAPATINLGVRAFGPDAGYGFGGEIDEAATWNIQRHTSGFTAPTAAYTGSESGLTALWHLDSSGTDSATGSGGGISGGVSISPNNSAINYSPYNWYANGSTEAVSWNFCGYFSTIFTGSACVLNFNVSGLGSAYPPVISWRIDDRAWTRTPIASTVTLTVPSPSGTSSNTYHHLEVFVVSNDNSGNRFSATAAPRLRFTGITLVSGAVVLQPVKLTQNVLIFGDSIVEGAQNITTDLSPPYTEQSDSSLSWAAFQREALGAEIGQVGWGSTGYTVGAADVPNFQTHWNLLATGISRPLTPEPDLVVINHGTNDSSTDITTAARTVVNAMLAQWPHTRIILLNPIVQPTDPQPRANPNTYLQAAAATCNDPSRVTFLSTLGLYDYSKGSAAPGFHPSEANVTGLVGRNIANLLRPYLADRLVKRWQYA